MLGDEEHERAYAAATEQAAAGLESAGVTLLAPALRRAGLMLFSFRDVEHAPMRVRVLEATVDLDGEGAQQPAQARHYSVDSVPYERMWADDRVWMPTLLARADSYFEGHFVFDGGPGGASRLVAHNYRSW